MNRELILECSECGASKLHTFTWEGEINYIWCSCGGMLEPVAFAADLKPEDR